MVEAECGVAVLQSLPRALRREPMKRNLYHGIRWSCVVVTLFCGAARGTPSDRPSKPEPSNGGDIVILGEKTRFRYYY